MTAVVLIIVVAACYYLILPWLVVAGVRNNEPSG